MSEESEKKTKQKSKPQNKNKSNSGQVKSDSSGFSFNWDKSKQSTAGTVFRKRDKANSNNNNDETVDKSSSNFKKSSFNADRSVKPNFKSKFQQNKGNFRENNDNDGGDAKTFIKRKQKKDKLLLKKAREEGEESSQNQVNTSKVTHNLFSERGKDLYVDTRGGVSVSEKVFSVSGQKFSDLDIHKHVVSNLEKHGFDKLTTVQERAIPDILKGKNALVRSQTGSGKTLAYAVPIIDALQGLQPKLKRTDGVQAIIVVPTRELALQTHEIFGKINTFQCIVVGHLCGGENRKSEKDRIRKGINVLIGTPGRLLDHVLHTNSLKVDKVRCLVLDEADRLLDMGFRKDIISLVEHIDKSKEYSEYDPIALLKSRTNASAGPTDDSNTSEEEESGTLPPLKDFNSKGRQTILLSATLTKAVSELADFTMKDHVFIDALDAQMDKVMSESYVIPSTVKQEFILSYVKHRLFTLSALIVAKAKQNSKIFVFMASTQMVEYHHELFSRCLQKMPRNRGKLKAGNVTVLDDDSDDSEDEEMVLDTQFYKLHGSMDQKMRKEVFLGFRKAKCGVLLCTDVAARGIDVPEADCIVQYTGPQTDEDYLHRVGRTGRAGKSGSAIIFLTHEEQEYITRLREHKVFLKKKDPEEFLKHLCDIMDEPDVEKAATALQKRYENALLKDKELYTSACFAYSSWSRFYNAYSAKLRPIFDFKKLNLGHYVTSFALKDTPTQVAKVIKGQVSKVEAPRLNRKLANHMDEDANRHKSKNSNPKPKKRKSLGLTTSEFASGLGPSKKKKKKLD